MPKSIQFFKYNPIQSAKSPSTIISNKNVSDQRSHLKQGAIYKKHQRQYLRNKIHASKTSNRQFSKITLVDPRSFCIFVQNKDTLSLIKSISGIRGTIGGATGQNLTPVDIVECSAGYASFILEQHEQPTVIIGRDARPSGALVEGLVIQTLLASGIHVIQLGLSTTPTVEMAVTKHQAQGGIIITASHNPIEWNALKFLNSKGEFISAEDGRKILDIIDRKAYHFVSVHQLGTLQNYDKAIEDHINALLQLPYLDTDLIRSKKYHVIIDPVNSTGSMAIPPLLDALGCTYTMIHADCSGLFAHNPEPLPEHLRDLSEKVIAEKADLGISVDPDVDRLALVCEDGSMFGEEYTLVAVADFILSKKPGNTVSNLSSTRALRDVTARHGGIYTPAAVGEVNVVRQMKDTGAVIGGEGNGGIILPDLHYGRDSLVGIALILNLMAEKAQRLSELKMTYPAYVMSKDKVALHEGLDVDALLDQIAQIYAQEQINREDGVKIDFEDSWLHIRKSNTEPIIRIYAEAKDEHTLKQNIDTFKLHLKNIQHEQ
jgi:phosphomannomutase